MNKRSTKFYRKNEEQVMKRIGLTPTPNSGAGEVWKEDGQSEHFICQLKSTDHQSISVKQQDIHTLEYNAMISHKLPIFAIQFLNTDEVWLMVKDTDIEQIKNILLGKEEEKEIEEIFEKSVDKHIRKSYNIDSNKEEEARERFKERSRKEREAREENYKKRQKEKIREWRKSLNRKG